MMHIDVQSVILILISWNLISLLMFIMQETGGRMPSGDRYYIAARVIQACGWAFISFHGRFLFSMPYGIGCVILTAGFTAETAALLSPSGPVTKRLVRFSIILPLIALLNIVNPADLTNSTITGIESVIFSIPFFISGFIICLNWRDSSRLGRMAGIVILVCSLFLFGRAIVILGSDDDLAIPYSVHVITMMVFFILLAVNSVSYILFTKELLEQSLVRETSTDYLTGVSNRRGFENDAQKYVSLATRISIPLTLLMIDIDNFKRINHRFGHAAGDLFLREFAETVTRILRCYDLVCRYGGEEFVVLLPNTSAETGRHVAERIRAHADTITVKGYTGLRCSVSVGISSAGTGDEKSILKMYDESEEALYRAKRSGRNRVCLSSH